MTDSSHRYLAAVIPDPQAICISSPPIWSLRSHHSPILITLVVWNGHGERTGGLIHYLPFVDQLVRPNLFKNHLDSSPHGDFVGRNSRKVGVKINARVLVQGY